MTGSNLERRISVDGEYGYLLHLIRCGIHGQTPKDIPDGLSFRKIYDDAMEHDVANLAFYGIEKLEHKPEKELYHSWRSRRDLALVRDINQIFAREEIRAELTTKGIPYKELQGTVIKKLYPSTEYRTMSDLDFIVERSRLADCVPILEQLGYRIKKIGEYEINGFRAPDIFVEIHTDYFSEGSDYYGLMDLSFSETAAMDGESELYLYTVLHTAKHYFSGGCGIRRVLDMYYLDQRYGDKVDRKTIDAVLAKADLTDFECQLVSLARAWFGTDEQRQNISSMEQYIFHAGLHGKRETGIYNRLRKREKGERITLSTKVKYTMSRLFPGDVVMVRAFPVLKKYRILYPFCWIYRIFRMLCGKNRASSVLDLKMIFRVEDHRDPSLKE